MKSLVWFSLGGTALIGVAVGCGLVDTSSCEDGKKQPYSFLALAFPEKQCEPVKFPLGSNDVGSIFGKIVDGKDRPVPGARVSSGAQATVAGRAIRQDQLFATVDAAERAKHRTELGDGEFVLENLPPQKGVLTVQYDEKTYPWPFKLSATNSFNIAVKDGVHSGGDKCSCKFGVPNIGDVKLDTLILPDVYGLRMRVSPTVLTATATGSKAAFDPPGSIVTLELRNGPHGEPAQLNDGLKSVQVQYKGANCQAKTVDKSISPVIVAKGLDYAAGPVSKLTVDLADPYLTESCGSATAKIVITAKGLKEGDEAKKTGESDTPLESTINITVTPKQ